MAEFADEAEELEHAYNELRNEFNATREEFDRQIESFKPKVDTYAAALAAVVTKGEELHESISARLQETEFDLEAFPVPEPELLPEHDGLLYDSTRTYMAQLGSYKAYRHGWGNGNGSE
jgi:hypothetical protein